MQLFIAVSEPLQSYSYPMDLGACQRLSLRTDVGLRVFGGKQLVEDAIGSALLLQNCL